MAGIIDTAGTLRKDSYFDNSFGLGNLSQQEQYSSMPNPITGGGTEINPAFQRGESMRNSLSIGGGNDVSNSGLGTNTKAAIAGFGLEAGSLALGAIGELSSKRKDRKATEEIMAKQAEEKRLNDIEIARRKKYVDELERRDAVLKEAEQTFFERKSKLADMFQKRLDERTDAANNIKSMQASIINEDMFNQMKMQFMGVTKGGQNG